MAKPRRGRPPLGVAARTRGYLIRVSAAERAQWQSALAADETVADLVRAAVATEIVRRRDQL